MIVPRPWVLIVVGLVLVLAGFVLPFLMVMRLIQPNFALSFLSYAASTIGLFLGMIGIAMQMPRRKK
jgi:di/tricarboxylate transporter